MGHETAIDALKDDLLACVERDLATAKPWHGFSPEVERRYRAFTDATRIRHLIRFSLLGLGIYNLFRITDWQMMHDVFVRGLIVQTGLVTPLGLLVIQCMRRRRAYAQPLLAALLTLITTCSVTLYAQSRTDGALLMPFSFPTIMISANIMLPLRFRLAVVFSTLSMLLILPAVLLHPGYPDGVQGFVTLITLSTCAFTLFANYQMEASERRAYLLSLRERLRAETLAHDNQSLRTLSGTDGLTGIGNRRLFDAALERAWHAAAIAQEPLGLLLLDADHFKALNDRHGHQAGDRCLVIIAALLREQTRDDLDCCARYGGEEFAVLLPGATLSRAQEVAERLRAAVEAAPVALDGPPRPGALRVSAGCASMVPREVPRAVPQVMPGEASGAAALIEAADAMLYAAKRAGRNRVHPPITEAELLPFRASARG